MSNSVIRKNVIAVKQRELRQKLWPSVSVDLLWKKESKGFTSIPRTLPIFFEIMDSLSNGKPVSRVYFELWCRAFDEHFVTLNNRDEMALFSGFDGQRATQAWASRIDILERLGFIKLAPGPSGDRGYALILNPYLVVDKLFKQRGTKVLTRHYNALVARATEIKATDI